MSDPAGNTTHLLHQLKAGNKVARNDLIRHACERLRCLSRRMLQGYPRVGRWEEADDVLQNALIRLDRALSKVPLDSSKHFWNLAKLEVRRELNDLARHHLGPAGHGANHHTDPNRKAADDPGGCLRAKADDRASGPETSELRTAVFEQVAALPDEERAVFNLLMLDGLTQEQAANVLGVSLRTVKRRWQSARILLDEALGGQSPEFIG